MASKVKPYKYIILLWEMLPDSIDVFVFPKADLSKEDIQLLHKCHGNYINGDGGYNTHDDRHTKAEIDLALATLAELLADPNADWLTDEYRNAQAKQLGLPIKHFNRLLGSWHKYKIDTNKPKILPRARFFQTGYLM